MKKLTKLSIHQGIQEFLNKIIAVSNIKHRNLVNLKDVASQKTTKFWFTSVSKIAGTMDYMAPKYMCYGQVSAKLDVFSFGVLLLEIVSGRKNIDFILPTSKQCLVQWAQRSYANKIVSTLKDKSLKEISLIEDVTFKQVVEVGLQCLHHVVARRPTMSEVVAMLNGKKKVEYCAFEDYSKGLGSLIGTGSLSFTFATKSFLISIEEDNVNSNKQVESHKQALQLSEIKLLSK